MTKDKGQREVWAPASGDQNFKDKKPKEKNFNEEDRWTYCQ